MQQKPKVTVVVCTYDRPENLHKCLASLREQTRDHDVVVVYRPAQGYDSEGRDDATTREGCDNGATIFRQHGTGIAAARNLGLHAAKSDIVAYIDYDCTAEPDWLGLLVEKISSGASAVSGTALTGDSGRVEFQNGVVDIYGRGLCRNPAPGAHYVPGGRYYNNLVCMNSAFNREHALEVGGFDEYYNSFYEETDLAVRLIKAGYKVVHEPGAIVHHWPVEEEGRPSRSLYNISKNTTCLPLRHFGNTWKRRRVLQWLAYRRMLVHLIPMANGRMTPGEYARCCYDIHRGYRQGLKDGKQ